MFVFSNLAMHSGLLLEVCKCDQGYRLRSPITSRIRFADCDPSFRLWYWEMLHKTTSYDCPLRYCLPILVFYSLLSVYAFSKCFISAFFFLTASLISFKR